jgi:hypothetical protein
MTIENSLLWRMKPQDAARLIVLEPISKVERHKFWHKREMRIKHSRLNKPRFDDVKRMGKAAWDGYWEAFHEDWAEQFLQLFPKPKGLRPENPLMFEQQVWEHNLYSQADFEEDMEYYNEARAYAWLRFVRGQIGEWAHLDGLVYLAIDSALAAEQLRCKNKRIVTQELIKNKRAAKRRSAPRRETWLNIGRDADIAMRFKQAGHTIRKIDSLTDRHYEVLMT